MAIGIFIFLYLSVGACWVAAARNSAGGAAWPGAATYALFFSVHLLFWPWLALYTLFCKLFASM